MADESGYIGVRVREDVRNDARVTKTKLGVTWSEFLDRAADTLDPENNS